MRKILCSLLAIAVLMSSTSCGSDDSGGPTGNQNTSTMTFTVDGAAFTSTAVICSRSGNTANISAIDATGRDFDISVSTGNSTGTFTVTSGAAAVTLVVGSQAWVGHLSGASGAVFISALSATSMTGTFDITLTAQTATGATGTRRVIGTFTGKFGQT